MTDRLRGWLLVAAQFALLAVLVPTGTTWAVPDVARLAGTVGRTTGAALIVLGGIRLGAAASVHPAPTTEARLRTDGAYRYARHPIYTGVLVLGAAIALTARSPSHLVAWAALPGVLSLRSRFEEGLLTERFPDYPAYMPQTRRFVPFPTRRPGPDEDRSRTQHRHRRHAPSSSGPSPPTSPPWAGGAPSPDRPRGSRQPTGPSRALGSRGPPGFRSSGAGPAWPPSRGASPGRPSTSPSVGVAGPGQLAVRQFLFDLEPLVRSFASPAQRFLVRE